MHHATIQYLKDDVFQYEFLVPTYLVTCIFELMVENLDSSVRLNYTMASTAAAVDILTQIVCNNWIFHVIYRLHSSTIWMVAFAVSNTSPSFHLLSVEERFLGK